MGGRGSSGGNASTSGKKEVTVSDLIKATDRYSETHVWGTKATKSERDAANKNLMNLEQQFTKQASTDAGKVSILNNMKAGSKDEVSFSYRDSKNNTDNVFVVRVDKNTYRIQFPFHKNATYEGNATQVVSQLNKMTSNSTFRSAGVNKGGDGYMRVPVSYVKNPKDKTPKGVYSPNKTMAVEHPERIKKLK